MAETRKMVSLIQFTNYEGDHVFIAACDDGTLWVWEPWNGTWAERFKPIPGTAAALTQEDRPHE